MSEGRWRDGAQRRRPRSALRSVAGVGSSVGVPVAGHRRCCARSRQRTKIYSASGVLMQGAVVARYRIGSVTRGRGASERTGQRSGSCAVCIRRRSGSEVGPVPGAQFRTDVALRAHLTGSVQEPVVWRCACRRGSERRRIRAGSRGATSRLRLGRPDLNPGPSGAFARGPGFGVCATASRKAPACGFAAVQAADGGCLAARMATAMERAQQRARRSGNAVRSSLGKNHVVSRRDKKRLKRPGRVRIRSARSRA